MESKYLGGTDRGDLSTRQSATGGSAMLASVFDMLFGCSHKRYSFPITAKAGQHRPEAASVTGTYVVCLDCGKEFPYDWGQMKFVSNRHREVTDAAESTAGLKAA